MINKENWKENYTHISNEVIDNEKVLRVIKSGKINEYDENTYAKLVDSSFHNGIIEVKMLSRLLVLHIVFMKMIQNLNHFM